MGRGEKYGDEPEGEELAVNVVTRDGGEVPWFRGEGEECRVVRGYES